MLKIQSFSYHSHTNFSDGKNTIEEMVRCAKDIGFTELGISDHLIVHKNMQKSPSCKVNPNMLAEPDVYNTDFKHILQRFQHHCEELRQVAKSENFKLYIGFEVDFFTYDGWLEELKDFLSQLDYDYLINGNHFLFDESGEEIINLTDLPKLYQDSTCYNDFLNRHFKVMAQAVSSKLFNFLAHIDYARKLGDAICSPDAYWNEKMAVLDALQKNDVGIEISTKGLRKIGDFYPSENVLAQIAKRDIAMVVSDDAHKPTELGLDFAAAEKMLQKYGVTRRIKF